MGTSQALKQMQKKHEHKLHNMQSIPLNILQNVREKQLENLESLVHQARCHSETCSEFGIRELAKE